MELNEENGRTNVVKIADLVAAASEQNFEKLQYLFDIITETESPKQKVGLCRYLFRRISYDNYTILVRLILMKVQKNKIKAVFMQQEDEVIRALKTKVNYQEIAKEMQKNDTLGILGVMLDAIDFIDLENIITLMPFPKLLLALGTKKFAQIYIHDYLGESPEELLSFLKINAKILPLDLIYNQYVEIITKYLDLRQEAVQNLIDFSKQNLKEKKSSLSLKNIIKLTLGLKNEEFQIVDKIVQQGTIYAYKIIPMKHYAQLNTDREKVLQPFKELLEKRIPAKHVIYIYMNTNLREDVQLNVLMEEMLSIGYSEAEVLNAVRDYWLVGRIKHVTEDGVVRVSADSISVSRLMAFNVNLIHISGKNGEWLLPKEGNTIYYKIRNYLSGGMFYIHYPCEKIEYVSKYEIN